MRKLLLSLALLSCAAICFAAADARPVVKIGLCTSLTGEMAHFGESTVAWKNYALKKLEEKNPQLRYEVFVEDDQMQSRQAILAAKRLVELNGVNVLLTYSSPSGSAVAPYANQKRVPHFAVAYNPAAVIGDYNVSMVPPPADYLPYFEKLVEKKGYKRIAVFYVRNATWQPIFDKLNALAQKGNFKITYSQTYNPGERDFRLGIQQMPADVEAIVLLAWSPEVNILASRLHEQGVRRPLIGIGGCVLFGDRSKYFEGAADIYMDGMPQADVINRQLTGKPIYVAYGPQAYDGIMMTASIYERYWASHKKLISPEEFMAEVKKLKDYPSILGPVSVLPSNYFSFQPHFYRIQDGGFKVLKLDQL